MKYRKLENTLDTLSVVIAWEFCKVFAGPLNATENAQAFAYLIAGFIVCCVSAYASIKADDQESRT